MRLMMKGFNWPSKSTLQSCMLGPSPAGFLLTGRYPSRCIALTAQDKVNVFTAFQKFNSEGALTLAGASKWRLRGIAGHSESADDSPRAQWN